MIYVITTFEKVDRSAGYWIKYGSQRTVGIDTPIQDEYEKQIDAILNFFHKTREDLANDVAKEEEKFLQWCEENS